MNPQLDCRPIQVLEKPSAAEFSAALEGEGQPIVIRNALDHWPARSIWTFPYFKALLRHLHIRPNTDIIRRKGLPQELTQMGNFIDRILSGDLQCEKIPDGTHSSPYVSFPLAQLGDLCEQLLQEVNPKFPFIPELLTELAPPLHKIMFHFPYGNLFIGPKGTRAFLHQDFWDSHVYIAMLQGQKQAWLFPPSSRPCLVNKEGERADVLNPNWDQFPRLSEAQGFTGIIKAGDLLFLPSNWYHDVVSLSASISLSWNGFTTHNILSFMDNILSNPGKLAYTLTSLPEVGSTFEEAYREILPGFRPDARIQELIP